MALSPRQLRFLWASGALSRIGKAAKEAGKKVAKLGPEISYYARRNQPANIIEKIQKTTIGSVGEEILEGAKEHEFRGAIQKGIEQEEQVIANLHKGVKAIGARIAQGQRNAEKRALKIFKNSPILSIPVRAVGAAGRLTGKVAGRLIGGGIDIIKSDAKIKTARDIGAIASNYFENMNPRALARDLRRAKGPFVEKVTKPFVEHFTGKEHFVNAASVASTKKKFQAQGFEGEDLALLMKQSRAAGRAREALQQRGPGLGTHRVRSLGLFQRIRKAMDVKPERYGNLTSNIMAQRAERARLRSTYLEPLEKFRAPLRRKWLAGEITEGQYRNAVRIEKRRLIGGRTSQGQIIQPAIPVARENYIKARRGLFNYVEYQDDTGKTIRTKVGNPQTGFTQLAQPFKRRYLGGKAELGSTAIIGGTTVYVGNKKTKEWLNAYKQSRESSYSRKDTERQLETARTQLMLSHPELDEYERDRLAREKVKVFRIAQAQAASTQALKETLLSQIPRTFDNPQKAPRESSLSKIKSKKKKLKKILAGR